MDASSGQTRPFAAFNLLVEPPREDRQIRVEVAPETREVVVKLPTPFRIRGTVVDSNTGKPIERFRLTNGTDVSITYARSAPSLDDRDRPSWNRDRVQTMTSGHFEADFPSMALCSIDSYSAAFRVDADGYAPAISRFFRENEGK